MASSRKIISDEEILSILMDSDEEIFDEGENHFLTSDEDELETEVEVPEIEIQPKGNILDKNTGCPLTMYTSIPSK